MTGVLDEHIETNADEKDEPFEDWARIFEKEGCTSAHLNPAPTVHVR